MVGSAHKQIMVEKGQLMRGFRQQWNGGPEVESEVRVGSWPSPSGLLAHPALWAGGPSNCWESVPCRAPEPSLRPPTSLGPGLEVARLWWTFLSSLSLRPNSSSSLSGSPFVGPGLLCFGCPEEPDGQSGPCCPAASEVMAGQGVGDLALREPPAELCLPLSQDRDLGGWQLYLGSLPFLVGTENNTHLVESYRNFFARPWPDFKDSDTKKFAATNCTPPHLLLWKVFWWELSGTLGFAGHEPPMYLHGPVISLSLSKMPVFYCLALLCITYVDWHSQWQDHILKTFVTVHYYNCSILLLMLNLYFAQLIN